MSMVLAEFLRYSQMPTPAPRSRERRLESTMLNMVLLPDFFSFLLVNRVVSQVLELMLVLGVSLELQSGVALELQSQMKSETKVASVSFMWLM
jgi:hypothetical protein